MGFSYRTLVFTVVFYACEAQISCNSTDAANECTAGCGVGLTFKMDSERKFSRCPVFNSILCSRPVLKSVCSSIAWLYRVLYKQELRIEMFRKIEIVRRELSLPCQVSTWVSMRFVRLWSHVPQQVPYNQQPRSWQTTGLALRPNFKPVCTV